MEASEVDDLHGPALSRIDYVNGAPAWWIRGTKIRRKTDHQKARAAYAQDGSPVACLERGIAGTFKMPAAYHDWESDEEPVALTWMEKARISYSADRALLSSLGVPGVPEWNGLIEQNRIAWMSAAKNGVLLSGDHAVVRNKLRSGILVALEPTDG